MSIENKLSGLIFGVKTGTKTATDVEPVLSFLRKNNPLIAEEYDKKLKAALVSRTKAQA